MLIPVSPSIGLPALAGLVLGESAGLPIPGETALIASGGLAATGQLSLWSVIVVATIAAIIGDSIGYTIGRRGGRKLLLRPGRFSAHRHSAVEKTDKYFAKYGLVTVFFARFVPGVRVVGALAAGAAEMPWRQFFIANALGCLAWASTVATIAYLVGPEGAVVMVIIGFSIAGLGLIASLANVRAHRVDDADPLEGLAAEAQSIVAATPVADSALASTGTVRVPARVTALPGSTAGSPAPRSPHPAAAAMAAACSNRAS